MLKSFGMDNGMAIPKRLSPTKASDVKGVDTMLNHDGAFSISATRISASDITPLCLNGGILKNALGLITEIIIFPLISWPLHSNQPCVPGNFRYIKWAISLYLRKSYIDR